jgi:transposase
VHIALDSPLAKEALERIGGLYQIEDHIRGSSPEQRLVARQQYAVPLLDSLHTWMIESVSQIEKKSELAEAFHYSLHRWDALCRYTQDGRLEIDNNIAERSIRGIGRERSLCTS